MYGKYEIIRENIIDVYCEIVRRGLECRDIKKLVIHCSASNFGNVERIERWHKERGFREIGYHLVILNGRSSNANYQQKNNGVLQVGRDICENGAHARGHNHDSIGLCAIAEVHVKDRPDKILSYNELKTLREIVNATKEYFPDIVILGHNDLTKRKICPGFDVEKL